MNVLFGGFAAHLTTFEGEHMITCEQGFDKRYEKSLGGTMGLVKDLEFLFNAKIVTLFEKPQDACTDDDRASNFAGVDGVLKLWGRDWRVALRVRTRCAVGISVRHTEQKYVFLPVEKSPELIIQKNVHSGEIFIVRSMPVYSLAKTILARHSDAITYTKGQGYDYIPGPGGAGVSTFVDIHPQSVAEHIVCRCLVNPAQEETLESLI